MMDHQPLVSYLNNSNVSEQENRRMMNLRRKTDNFDFEKVYCPGTDGDV